MTDHILDISFPIPTHDEWVTRAEKALKGVSLEKLTRLSRDGIAIHPLYAPGDKPALATRPGGVAWKVVQKIDQGDASEANAQALEDLENGATGLCLAMPHMDGPIIERALKDVQLHAIHLRLESHADVSDSLIRLCEARAINPERLDIALSLPDAKIAKALRARDFAGGLLLADGRAYHNQGASEAQELGFALYDAIQHLRGLDGDVGAVHFALSAGPDMFMNIAKFRAIRLLWARVLDACGIAQRPVHVHGETSYRHLSLTDQHVNMLRAVAGVFGAGLGGADSQVVLPFTHLKGEADGFARRMARNAQIILLEESQLHAVGDPAAGSGYMESLTLQLAEKAWGFMQKAETGADKQAFIAEAKAAQMAQVAKRTLPITGTSEFPNLAEALEQIDSMERLSSPFEALRLAAQKAKPTVQLINLGKLADHSARSHWTQNLLAAGGIAVSEQASSVVILCGSDEAYAQEGADAMKAAQAQGAKHIWLAGKYELAGAKSFYAGMNMLEFLSTLHQELGVAQ